MVCGGNTVSIFGLILFTLHANAYPLSYVLFLLLTQVVPEPHLHPRSVAWPERRGSCCGLQRALHGNTSSQGRLHRQSL